MNSIKTGPGPRASRRSVIQGLGAAAAFTAMPAILRAQPATLTFPNSGGAWEDAARVAYFDTFRERTGIQILGAPYMEVARVRAMVDNNAVDVDIMNIDATEAAALARLGLLEEIDYSGIDTSVLMPGTVHPHYFLLDVAAYIMAWNTRSFDESSRPRNWAEYFDVDGKPGQRSLWRMAPQTLEVAAMAGGQPGEALYPIDLDLAFSQLDRVKDDLTWWSSGAQGAQLVIDGEVDMGVVWNGRVFQAKIDGAPVDYTFDQALFVCDAIVIPKGARNKEAAQEFIRTLLDAQNQATFAKHIPYGPVNTEAFALMSPEELALLPNSPQNGGTGVLQDFDYWAEHGPELFDRFNRWLLG